MKFTTTRALRSDDFELIYRWENLPELWRVSDEEGPFSRSSIALFFNRCMEPQPEIERHIIENGDGFPIGIIDLFQIDRIAGSAGIGIFIADKRHRRLGHASQALTLLIDELCKRRWLFLRALIHLENQASIRLFESAGFSPGAEVLYRGLPARQYVLHLKHNIS